MRAVILWLIVVIGLVGSVVVPPLIAPSPWDPSTLAVRLLFWVPSAWAFARAPKGTPAFAKQASPWRLALLMLLFLVTVSVLYLKVTHTW